MKTLNPYLVFNGNCREAMLYYQECLGGKLHMQTIAESPLSENMPEKMRDCILHASLTCDQLCILASDMVGEMGLIRGNSVALMLDCANAHELTRLSDKLSEGGRILHPMETTKWGAVLCDFTDKFGNNWILHCDSKKSII
ncbi:MAG: VOC family protein [Flavobacteriales bacterium]